MTQSVGERVHNAPSITAALRRNASLLQLQRHRRPSVRFLEALAGDLNPGARRVREAEIIITAPHGGNHLILRPLGPLIREAKLSHTSITSGSSLLLDLQELCTNPDVRQASSPQLVESVRNDMCSFHDKDYTPIFKVYVLLLDNIFTSDLYRPKYTVEVQDSLRGFSCPST